MLIVSKKEFTEAIYLSVYLSLCPSIHLSIHSLFIYLVMHSTSNTEHLTVCQSLRGLCTYIHIHALFIHSSEQLGEECVIISEAESEPQRS